VAKRRAENCYFFSSHFLTQLVHDDLLAKAVPDHDCDEEWNRSFNLGFNSVRKWTNHLDIFEKKYLFIPVNLNVHWSMIVVCNPGNNEMMNRDDDRENKANQDNAENDAEAEIPAFVCMDSLKDHPQKQICQILRRYFNQLKKMHPRFNRGAIPVSLTDSNFRDVYPEVPLQQNSFDCGVFVLKYAAWFFNAYIQGCAIPINRKSVAQNLKGFVDKNMFRYSGK
jgi:sentrin-specific protease 7